VMPERIRTGVSDSLDLLEEGGSHEEKEER
jgi:hypothetical protein